MYPIWHKAKVYLCVSSLYDGWLLYPTWTKPSDSSLMYISTNIHNFWKQMLHLCTDWRYILYSSIPYYCWLLYQIWTKSTLSFQRYHNKYITFVTNIATITQIWHRAKCYWVTVPNMNKINPFSSELAHQTRIIAQVWHLRAWARHGTWWLYQIWTKSQHFFTLRYYMKY